MENVIEDQAVQAEISPRRPDVTQESRLLLQALQAGQIRFAHWKSNSHLAEGLAGKTDLDLLVWPADKPRFDAVLASRGYKKLQSQPWSTYPQVEDWMGMDQATGRLLHLHTHYALVTGIRHVKHLYLPWQEAFFGHLRVEPESGWPIPRPEMEAILLLIRIWAKTPPLVRLQARPAIPAYLQQELVALVQQSHPADLADLAGELNLQVPADLGLKLRKIAEENDAEAILGLSRYFYGQLKGHYRMAWPLALASSFYQQLRLKARSYASRLAGPFRLGKRLSGQGKVIALIGCDGSGKSSLSQDILRWLSYKIDTHYFYLGKTPHIKSYNKTVLAKEDLLFRKTRLSGAIKKLIGNLYFVILIRKKVAMLLTARKLQSQGSIVLCDRFPQPDMAGMNDGPHLPAASNSRASLLEQAQFRQLGPLAPDLVFRLQVSPQTAFTRKPEHNFEQIKVKSEAINKISFPGSVLVDIDANKPYEQVLLHIKREIWKRL